MHFPIHNLSLELKLQLMFDCVKLFRTPFITHCIPESLSTSFRQLSRPSDPEFAGIDDHHDVRQKALYDRNGRGALE